MHAQTIAPVIFCASPSSRALLRHARRFADVGATVLVTGETGVGKNALARYLHAASARRAEPFVTVDCPAIPATLVEAELFGHERGAFTDATIARAGRFELAGAGTLYLDAVTGLTAMGQGALLRVLEERTVSRLGGTSTVPVNARIVASADAAVEQLVRDGQFRAELFHRLCVLPIRIPPLRERPADILPLARRFTADICQALRQSPATIARDAGDALVRYPWPGNVRELRHVLERVLLTGARNEIHAADLPLDLVEAPDVYSTAPAALPPTLAEVERRYIAVTLHRTRGNQSKAAAILGISRKALWEKRKRFDLA
ncbi:MAG TPA: sigma-54 dependent transcriptional regulator [Hyalangium sp.]|nr:sigma-54 dependent transcriptional regulator [Hyalangium sp.]